MLHRELGGQRLGSGKKMDIALRGYERSTHNLNKIWRSTMACGTLVPCYRNIVTVGDTFDIDIETLVRTKPTNGPLFGSFKMQIDLFQIPIRLYNGILHGNPTKIGMNMNKVKFPMAKLKAKNLKIESKIPIEYQQFDQSCLWAYLGQRGIGQNERSDRDTVERERQALFMLAYYDIYKNYYANKQEGKGAILTIDEKTVEQNLPTKVTAYGSTNNRLVLKTKDEMQKGQWEIPAGAKTIDIEYNKKLTNYDYLFVYVDEIGGQSYQRDLDIQSLQGILGAKLQTLEWGVKLIKESADMPKMTLGKWSNIVSDLDGELRISTFDLENIDEMRYNILRSTGTAPYVIDTTAKEPYLKVVETLSDGTSFNYFSQNGLALKTYQSDIFNNWLCTEWIDGENGIAQLTAVSAAGGKIFLDDLNIMGKVYNLMNRIAVSGGTYEDWIEAVWGEEVYRRAESPVYMGGLSTEIIFNEVVSTADTQTPNAGDQPLGSLAGKGTQAGNKKGGQVTIKVKEPSLLIGIASITPRIDYSQGNAWFTDLETLDDLHKPALDGIGFQELITEQMFFADTYINPESKKVTTHSAGKQPAWINYMTDYNETYGNFAHPNQEMFMTLNRRYEMTSDLQNIKDLTTYIDPSKYNYIFADTDLKAQNFWVQIAFDITARRKMSAKIIPNL